MESALACRGNARLAVPCRGRLAPQLLRPVRINVAQPPTVQGAPKDVADEPVGKQQQEPIDVEAVVEPVETAAEVVEPAEAAATEPVSQGGDAAPTPPGSHPLEDLPEVEEEEDLIASKELVAEIMDGSSFGRRGEGWFFAVIGAIAMLVFPPLTLKGLVDFAATLALTSSLVFMLTSLFSLGRNLSPLPQPRKKHRLVVSGIYGYVRHPMYGGMMLAALGVTILTRNETRLAICALLWYLLERVVAVEEKALSERYPEYAEYKAKVKKFIPFIY